MTENFKLVRGVLLPSSPSFSAFDYLIAHARAAAFRLVPRSAGAVRSIELQWPQRSRNPYSIQVRPDHVNFYMRRPILSEHPDLFSAATRAFGPVPPNSLDEYRTRLRTVDEANAVLTFLRQQSAWPDRRHDRYFDPVTFETITGEHILRAAERLAAGAEDHAFRPSTDYDLLFNGERLPPKAVFGLAASQAAGFPVKPENFPGGENTFCFRILRHHGYLVAPKDARTGPAAVRASDEDRVWAEGSPRLVAHLRRERATGVAAAKRDQFRRLHGRLFCERCQMDPVTTFGSGLGEACIEVHHRSTAVADMAAGHETRLEDLQCLCANCHRVTHREMKSAEDQGDGTRDRAAAPNAAALRA